MFSVFLSALVLGLLSSPHCMGMCGPLITAYSLSNSNHKKTWFHITYNLGRAISYSLLGALIGYLGDVINSFLHKANVPYFFEIIGSALLIFYGIIYLFPILPKRFFQIKIATTWRRPIIEKIRSLSPASTGLLGFSTGFLPCHAFIPAFALVVSSASWLYGMMIMFLFFLGTLPSNVGYGVFISYLGSKNNSKVTLIFRILLALLSIAMGVYMFWKRGQIFMFH